jgi:hypothetical protein
MPSAPAQPKSNQRERAPVNNILGIVARTALLTALMEAVTLLCRFGFDIQATRDTASTVGRIACGLRIHHGYIGLAAVAVGLFLWRRPALRHWLLITGSALVLSDLIHHFLVLWPLLGDPEFHLVYPK